MAQPWLGSLINKIQSKAPPVRFQQIDVAIVMTIDQNPLIIEFFHEQVMFLNAFHVRLRLYKIANLARLIIVFKV
jgi:hypothetical protein